MIILVTALAARGQVSRPASPAQGHADETMSETRELPYNTVPTLQQLIP